MAIECFATAGRSVESVLLMHHCGAHWGWAERWDIRGSRFPDEPGREEHEARACGALDNPASNECRPLGLNWRLALYAVLIEHQPFLAECLAS